MIGVHVTNQPPPGNGWSRWENHVLSRLDSMEKAIGSQRDAIQNQGVAQAQVLEALKVISPMQEIIKTDHDTLMNLKASYGLWRWIMGVFQIAGTAVGAIFGGNPLP